MKEYITLQEANEMFRYDEESGKLYWKVDRGRGQNMVKNKEVGTFDHHKTTIYRRVSYNKKKYQYIESYGLCIIMSFLYMK